MLDLNDLKEDYYEDSNQKISEIETLILELENDKVDGKNLDTLFRITHSLKGSAGTFDLYTLANISHRFENIIVEHQTEKQEKFSDMALYYVDLARSCISDYRAGSFDAGKQSTLFDNFLALESGNRKKILLVGSSKVNYKIVKKYQDSIHFDLDQATDATSALVRLIHERFDLVISPIQMAPLDGISLVRAMRVIDGANQRTPTAFISSSADSKKKIEKELKHTTVILKDDSFFKNVGNLLSQINKEEEDQIKVASNTDFKFKSVLYVDDDKMVHRIIQKAFSKNEEIKLTLSSEILDAVKQCASNPPDLIVLDCFLQDGSGADLLKLFHTHKLNKNIPIVFCTSSVDRVDLTDLQQYGNVKGILSKPIKIRTLIQDLNNMI